MEREVLIKGTGVSSGIAEGKLVYETKYDRSDISIREFDNDMFFQAVKLASEELLALASKARAELGQDGENLLETYSLILSDENYKEKILSYITEDKLSVREAIIKTTEELVDKICGNNEYMQSRADDLWQVAELLIDKLREPYNFCSANHNSNNFAEKSLVREIDVDLEKRNEPYILVARTMSPVDFIKLDKSSLQGLIINEASPIGHTVILAKSMSLPVIIGASVNKESTDDGINDESIGKKYIREISTYVNQFACMDGDTGEIFINPDETTLEKITIKKQKSIDKKSTLEELVGLPDETKSGQKIKVYANLNHPEEIAKVIKNDAKGIGLFRSEFLFLEKVCWPSEEEQFEIYRDILNAMDGKQVIIRTLDLGDDKLHLNYNLRNLESSNLDLQFEKNEIPDNINDIRGIKFLLANRDIFKTQLRALYRASAYGNLSIMFPMVSSVEEIRAAKDICLEIEKEIKASGVQVAYDVELGIMIETPDAVENSDEMAKEVDFFSIGTNDLYRKLSGASATAMTSKDICDVSDAYNGDAIKSEILTCIKQIADSAHKNKIWVGICGEMASDLELIPEYLSLGIDELSVAPEMVLPVRQVIRNI